MEKLKVQKQRKRKHKNFEKTLLKQELKLNRFWLFHEAIRYKMVCESLKLERKRNPNQYIV
ncbi:hypothetical protein KEJ37_06935 [Candidatus Bathyarchaeota archaeon]|nr:hypothetical protein [Candidatus Bathyarchaeota archaeon]